jgi:hypothetical protein
MSPNAHCACDDVENTKWTALSAQTGVVYGREEILYVAVSSAACVHYTVNLIVQKHVFQTSCPRVQVSWLP